MFFSGLLLKISGKKIPVYWGNFHWFNLDDEYAGLYNVFRFHPKWIDYSKLPNGETARMLSDDHPEAKFRQKFHGDLIDCIIKDLQAVDKENRVCVFTSGGTASGKTSAVDILLNNSPSIKFDGGVRIDYDRFKKMLPEYEHMLGRRIRDAAKYVQSESAKLGAKVFKKSYKVGTNIIFEQTLESPKMPLEYLKDLKKRGYTTMIIATHVEEPVGQERAATRFQRSGRYVAPEAISKIYSTVPTSLFELREKVDQIYLYDNNGTKLELMFTRDNSAGRVGDVINPLLYESYLTYVGKGLDLSL